MAAGRGGMLAAWVRNELGTLRLPVESAVVALAVTPILVDTGPASVAVAPQFPPGLAAATEGAGLWLLRSTGSGMQWQRLTSLDGLPSDTLRALASDTHGRLWVATSRGLARVRRDGPVDAWPADAVLGGEVLALHCGPDGELYLGLGTGVARLEPRCEHPCVQLLRRTGSPVRGFAWAGGELWWAEGDTARALSGRRRALGLHVEVAGRPGARWQPAPLWPGASAAADRAAVPGTLQPAGRDAECGASPMGPGSRGATPFAPGVVQWFDVRGRRLEGPGGARGVYFLRLPATNGKRAVRREVIVRPRSG